MKWEWCSPELFQYFPQCFPRDSGSCHIDNPGNIQSLHLLAHKVMPKMFDGIELEYIQSIDSNKLLTNKWILNDSQPVGSYSIGFRYEHDHGNIRRLYADMHPSTLSSNLGFVYYPFECMRMEGDMRRGGEDTQLYVEITQPGSKYTVNFQNAHRATGRCSFSVMRTLTNHWAAGGELVIDCADPETIMAYTVLAARYKNYKYRIAATASRYGCYLSYWQRLSENTQRATMLAWNRSAEKALATVCYQWKFWDSVVRGKIDSDLDVGLSFCRNLHFLRCGLGINVLHNLESGRTELGVKITFDPSRLGRGA